MREILHHLLGSCGESHVSLLTILSSGVVVMYRDYIVAMLKEVRDVIFK
jgi:hypothetical protein